MASSLFTSFCKTTLFFTIFLFLQLLPAISLEFDVGDEDGWAVPRSKNIGFYNKWAAENRFQVGDTIEFNYKKDSVMVVTDIDYKQCNSAHPIFFSNTGTTSYKFEHSGLFYFISGVSGHCQRGQKMIVKVMSHSSEAPENTSPPGGRAPPGPPSERNGAAPTSAASLVVVQLALLLVGSLFF